MELAEYKKRVKQRFFSYSTSEDDNFSGNFDNFDECLEVATDDLEDDESYVFIGVSEKFNPMITSDDIIERLQLEAYDECEEHSEDFLSGVSKEAEQELTELMTDVFLMWMLKHKLEPNFWSVYHTQEINVNDKNSIEQAKLKLERRRDNDNK